MSLEGSQQEVLGVRRVDRMQLGKAGCEACFIAGWPGRRGEGGAARRGAKRACDSGRRPSGKRGNVANLGGGLRGWVAGGGFGRLRGRRWAPAGQGDRRR